MKWSVVLQMSVPLWPPLPILLNVLAFLFGLAVAVWRLIKSFFTCRVCHRSAADGRICCWKRRKRFGGKMPSALDLQYLPDSSEYFIPRKDIIYYFEQPQSVSFFTGSVFLLIFISIYWAIFLFFISVKTIPLNYIFLFTYYKHWNGS